MGTRPVVSQVVIDPPRIEPTAWTRISFGVINTGTSPWTVVRVTVPDAIAVLGVDAPPGWKAAWLPATDSTPQTITWSGGAVHRAGLGTFVFLGRVGADVPRRELRFPVELTDASGTVRELRRGGDGIEPRMLIAGTTQISPWAAFALAGAAFGLAVLALVFVVGGKR
ncbi:MAG TPA: hypothetical protein VGA22_05140 [Gemmatimonadales bacterium]|jgi:hypothetical protein